MYENPGGHDLPTPRCRRPIQGARPSCSPLPKGHFFVL